MAKDAECWLIIGRRGSGKSVRARHLVRDRRRLIVVDPVRDWRDAVPPVADYDELVARLRRGWRRGFRLSWSPTPGNEVAEVDRLARLIMGAQRPYSDGAHAVKVSLVIDELNLAYPSGLNVQRFGGLQALVLQGRHYGVEMVGITQRPSAIRVDWRSNAAKRWYYPVEDHVDYETIRQQLGREALSNLRSLKPFHCLEIDAAGIRVAAPVPLR